MKLTLLLLSTFFLLPGFTLPPDDVILTIGDNRISKAEFEYMYRKNNQNLYDETDAKSPKEYLSLFIDYKLKVIEAENLKMDTSAAFQSELAGYRKELATPYLTDTQYNKTRIKTLYDRMTKEVRASHILLRVEKGASEAVEQKVKEKALDIRKAIREGKPFAAAAQEYSEDQGTAGNGGELGYFSAFRMIAPFEEAAFTTPVGEISGPVRTSFGYHLIKVHDIRKNRGEIKVAHIMKMFPRNARDFDKTAVKETMDSVYSALLQGAVFAEMAKKYSDDRRTKMQGGEMPWLSAGKMPPSFAEPAFALEKKGDFTQPVETPFGIHIIKKIDQRPVPPFEEARPLIEERIKKNPARNNSGKEAFVEKLKKKYHFKENRKNIQKLKSAEPVDEPGKKLPLFSIDNQTFTRNDFDNYLQEKNLSGKPYARHYEEWVQHEIIALEDAKLEAKYPEFKFLMNEYHDGILIFNLMEEKVWEPAAKDSAGLQEYYKKHKGKYRWEERFKGRIISCDNAKTREEAEKYFAADIPAGEVKTLLEEDGRSVEIQEGTWEKGRNPVVDYYVWDGPGTGDFDPALVFIRGDKIPPRPKTLEEARGQYISDYQNYLEKKWLKKLHKKYKIKVNKKILKTVPHV